MSYRVMLLLTATILCGCGSDGDGAVPPSIGETTSMEPAVREILEQTRQDVLNKPQSSDAWGVLGAAFHAHRLFAEARVCYERAVELDPSSFRWAYLLAVAADAGGVDRDELIPLFDKAATLQADYAPLPARLGYALSLRGLHDEALAAFEQAVRLDPTSPAALRGLGRTLLALDRPDDALQHLQRAVETDPNDANAFAALGQALNRTGETALAEQAAARAEQLPASTGMTDRVFQAEVTARVRSSSRAIQRANAAIAGGDFDSAIEALSGLVEARPDDAEAHVALGRVYEGRGDLEAAMRAYARAVELTPDSDALRFKLGATLLRAGRVEEGLDVFREVVQSRPADPETHFFLGQAYERAGQPEAAAKSYREALALRPDHRSREALDRLTGVTNPG